MLKFPVAHIVPVTVSVPEIKLAVLMVGRAKPPLGELPPEVLLQALVFKLTPLLLRSIALDELPLK